MLSYDKVGLSECPVPWILSYIYLCAYFDNQNNRVLITPNALGSCDILYSLVSSLLLAPEKVFTWRSNIKQREEERKIEKNKETWDRRKRKINGRSSGGGVGEKRKGGRRNWGGSHGKWSLTVTVGFMGCLWQCLQYTVYFFLSHEKM